MVEFFIAGLTECRLDKSMVPAVADDMLAMTKSDRHKAPELKKIKCNSRTWDTSFRDLAGKSVVRV